MAARTDAAPASRLLPRIGTRAEAGICALLLLLALVVRWWGLSARSWAMYGDEAQLMLDARRFSLGQYPTPFTTDMLSLPALYDYLLGFLLRLAGMRSVVAARAFSGALGALGVPLLYLTARALGYSRRVGLAAALVLATLFWDVLFSRLVLQNIMGATAASMAVLCLVLAVRGGRPGWAFGAGAALAWGCYAYLSGVMTPLALALWLAALLLGYCRWWQRSGEPAADGRNGIGSARYLNLDDKTTRPRPATLGWISLVTALTTLAGLWPFRAQLLSAASPFRMHVTSRFLFSAANRAAYAALHPDVGSGVPAIVWFQLKAAAGMFLVRGEPDPIFNVPGRAMLDPVAGALLVVGLAGLFWTWRRPASTLVVLWLLVPWILGVVLTPGTNPLDDPPSDARMLPALPALALCIGLGLDAVAAAAGGLLGWIDGRATRRDRTRLAHAMATLLICVVGALELRRYEAFVDSAVYRVAYTSSAHQWALLLGGRGPILVTVVGPTGWAGEFPALFAPEARLCAGRWAAQWTRCPPASVVIFDQDELDALHYATLARVPVHERSEPAGLAPFWYAEGTRLPDPATLLAH